MNVKSATSDVACENIFSQLGFKIMGPKSGEDMMKDGELFKKKF